MNLVIEDGSGVAGANSYASADDLFLYAAERNITVPTSEGDIEALLLKAMDFLETLTPNLIGYVIDTDQSLPFPRQVMSYSMLESIGVPKEVKKAQIVLAIAANSMELIPVSTGTEMNAIRKTVGPITVEYEAPYERTMAKVPQASALLRPFLAAGFGQPTIVRG